MIEPQIYIQNEVAFKASLREAAEAVSDLTIPLTLIAKDFYKSQRSIFMLKGPGQYADLSAKYKPKKERKWGFVYPILKASGALEASVTDPKAPGAINYIVNKKTLVLGTSVASPTGFPYPKALQEGTKNMPSRPFFFIGPESGKGTTETQGRFERWTSILRSSVIALADKKPVAE